MARLVGSSTALLREGGLPKGYSMFKLISALSASVLLCAAMTETAQASAGRTDFEILMNGRAIGHHIVTVTQAGGVTTARISIEMAGRVGPIGFTYSHRCEEQWRGAQLLSLDCTDRENRSTKTLQGSLQGANFVVNGSGFKGNAPVSILPTSWWRFSTVRQNRVMNSRDGKLTSLAASRVGPAAVATAAGPVQATHYRIRGPANTELYYDAAGRWVGNTFRIAGQSFVYRMITPVAGAPRE
jgi:Family of unknown function (DUF6134)